MSYIENTLLGNEKVVLLVRPHWVVFLTPIVSTIFIIFFFSLFLSGFRYNFPVYGFSLVSWAAMIATLYVLYSVVSALITFYFSEYGVTNRRVLMKVGMIQRNSLEVFLGKIEAIHVDQSILARFLCYGTLVVIGTGGSRDYFRWVSDPLNFRYVVQQQIDKDSGKV